MRNPRETRLLRRLDNVPYPVRALGLTDRVSFLGWIPNEALPAHERFEPASCLVHMVDDATNRAGGRFERQETI